MTFSLQILLPEEMRAGIRQAIWMDGFQTGLLDAVAVAVAAVWIAGQRRQ